MKVNLRTTSTTVGVDILTMKEPTGASMQMESEMEKENGLVSMVRYKKVIGLIVC